MVSLIENSRVTSSADFGISSEGKVIRQYTENRLVRVDTELSEYEVGLLLGYLPGQIHTKDLDAVLKSMKLNRRESRAPNCIWDLSLQFSTEGFASADDSADPTMQRVKRSWTTSEQTIHTFRDRNGDIIVNAADQPFDGGIPVVVEMPTLTYERNEFGFNGVLATAYANSLNQFSYSGAAPETLKLKISATEQHDWKVPYWNVKYEMAYYEPGWQPKVVNAGLFQLVGGELVRCRDRDRQDVTSPVPLDEDGLQIPQDELPDAVNYVDVDWHPVMNFADLGLPEN